MIDFMYTDNELILLSRDGNTQAEEELAKRYVKSVKMCARPFFLAGGDSEDLIQEGMLGLLRAIRTYNLSSNASFKTYAEQCIHNRIFSAIESASRFKHMPLNQGVSLDDFCEMLSAKSNGFSDHQYYRETEEEVIAKEDSSQLATDKNNILSKFEKSVLEMYLQGLSYKEIALQLNKTEKSIDNAVQRIRKKMHK